jgi:phosphate transport system protein
VVPAPLAQQLVELRELLGEMCVHAAGSLQQATTALLECRERLAVRVIGREDELVAMRLRVEELAGDALLFHQPVAGDLRAVGVHDPLGRGHRPDEPARAARGRGRRAPLTAAGAPAEVRDDFAEMGRLGVALATKAADVVRSRNVVRAVELDRDDDEMDGLHRRMFEVLMAEDWPHGVAAAVDVTLLARWYERFADHASRWRARPSTPSPGQEPDAIPI